MYVNCVGLCGLSVLIPLWAPGPLHTRDFTQTEAGCIVLLSTCPVCRGSVTRMASEGRYIRLPSDGSPRQKTCQEVVRKLVPIVEWLPAYHWKENLVKDVAAGVTLGCVLFAQSLAHATLSKVSLITGPYSCLVPPVLYSLFGTCVLVAKSYPLPFPCLWFPLQNNQPQTRVPLA